MKGIEISGHIWRLDGKSLGDELFWDLFADFIETNEWEFAGVTGEFDMELAENEPDGGES